MGLVMPYDERKEMMEQIEELRGGRTLVSLCNFDRTSNPELPGLSTQFHADLKESLYRVLKESPTDRGIDVYLYTRGGDTNSVWPIACLLREFDPDFQVLVPFRAHSAGTMLALAAKKIVMTSLGELSAIDPTTGNQFNPMNPDPAAGPGSRLGISVEDVRAYQDFLRAAFGLENQNDQDDQPPTDDERQLMQPFIAKLTNVVHPLALGNVHRVHQLVQRLARMLMELHPIENRDVGKAVRGLTVETYSHQHMIGRIEAIRILGEEHVETASGELESALDALLRKYEDDFGLRSPMFGARLMGPEKQEMDFRFVGGVLESKHWGYVFETKGKLSQHSQLPQGVSIQVPPGQRMPLVPGLPRKVNVEMHEQRWHRNIEKEGIDI